MLLHPQKAKAGQVCEIGDLIVALVDRSGSGNLDADWCVAQTNINGAITGIKSGDAYITTSQSGSVVTIATTDLLKYSCVVATVKTTDGTIINTAPMYFNGNTAKGFASKYGSGSIECVVNVYRHQPDVHGETGYVDVLGPSGGGPGGSLIALIGVI